jgi:hypothetical protein
VVPGVLLVAGEEEEEEEEEEEKKKEEEEEEEEEEPFLARVVDIVDGPTGAGSFTSTWSAYRKRRSRSYALVACTSVTIASLVGCNACAPSCRCRQYNADIGKILPQSGAKWIWPGPWR